MKILILGHKSDFNKIKNFEDVLSYYVPTFLQSKGAILTFISPIDYSNSNKDDVIEFYRELDVSLFDHVIAMGLRFFDKMPKECATELRGKVKGALCQFYDGGMLDSQNVDITFNFKDDSWKYPLNGPNNRNQRHHKFNKYVGWAADPELFKPAQSENLLNILVDHSAYDESSWDITLFIMLSIKAFVASNLWKNKFSNVIIKQIVDGNIVNIDTNNINVTPYSINNIPYQNIANELSVTHLFFVTHKESLGLSALEAAMAGALPVVPKGFIPEDRLSTIRNFEYYGPINWSLLLESLNPMESRELAIPNNWNVLVNNLYKHLLNFNKNSTYQ